MIKVEDLKKQILLQGLKEEHYKKLGSILECKRYEKGEPIFEEGDPPEGIYLIRRGRVKISMTIQESRQRTLVIFRDGNYFGDISALEKRPHSATATALTVVEVFLLRFEIFEGRNTDNLLLSYILLKRLALIASKNIRQMNMKFLRLEESF